MNTSGYICFGIDADSTWSPADTACSGASDGSLADSKWHHVEAVKNGTTSISLYIDGHLAQTTTVTATGTMNTSSSLYLGVDSTGNSNYWNGWLDEFMFYPYARSAAQVKTDLLDPVSVLIGSSTNDPLTQGLVGYWKMDESSGNAADSSGNSYTLTNNATATFAAGKFANAGSLASASSQYFNTATNMGNIQTTSFWVNPTSTTTYLADLNGTQTITATSGTLAANSFTGSTIYVNGDITSTITANVWQHVVVTSTTAYAASAFAVGKVGANYLNGSIDEARVYNRILTPREVRDLYAWAPGPVGYWNMDEKSGVSANDISGNGYTGTINGTASWKPGKYGSGLNANGSSTYVSKSSASSFDFDGKDFTVEAWIKPNAAVGDVEAGIVCLSSGSGGTTQWCLVTDNDDYVFWTDTDGSWAYTDAAATTDDVTTDWAHIVGVYTSGSSLKIYKNGVLIASDTSVSSDLYNPASPVIWIGRGPDHGYFNGVIDDVKIYNYARTQKQVVEDMNASHPSVGSPVGSAVGYWKFDEGYGTTANDTTPNGNNLTLSSASWTNSGKFGKAWDGTGARWLSRADDSDFDVTATDDYAISLWFKSDSATNPSAVEYLVNKASSVIAGYAIYANTSGQICFGIDDDTTWNPDIASCSTTDFYDATWHHAVAVRDTVQDKTYIYIDGVLRDSDTDSTSATLANSLLLYVGDRDGTDNGDEFTGDIDELKISRFALTSDEVKTDYNHGAALALGSLGTDPSNPLIPLNSSNALYCPPGNTEGNCANGSSPAPVGEWNFEEGSGASAFDSSGNGNTGTWAGTGNHWTQGKVGKGGKFNGSDDYVDAGNPSTLNFGTGNFTIGLWMKTSNTAGQTLLIKQFHPGQADRQGYFLYTRSTAPYLQFVVGDGSNYTEFGTVSTNYSDGNWHHVEVSKTSSLISLYVDGKLITTASTTSVTGSLDYSTNVKIGGDSAGYLNGSIDQVRIYNYARSPAQIAWDYNRGGPVAWYKFDECTGATANDASGNGYTGTITVGASGSQTSTGTCGTGTTTEAWNNGTTGKRNASINLDGNDDYVATGAFSPLATAAVTTTKASWGGWFYPTSSAASLTLMDKASEFRLTTDASSKPVCGVYYSAAFHDATAGSTALTLSAWNHVMCTYDGANIKTYLNGTLVGTTAETNNITAASSILYMGENSSSAQRVTGQLDDLRVYNNALTATQIKTLMNEGAVRFGPQTGSP